MPLYTIRAYDVAVSSCIGWVFKYGPPDTVLTGNGKQFAAQFFQAVCRHLDIANKFTTAYHPQANGQVERYNRTIAAMLRSYVNEHQDDWDRYVGALTHAYNCSVHRKTGKIPFELVLSRCPPPLSLHTSLTRRARPTCTSKEDYLRRLDDSIRNAHSRLMISQARYKKYFDRSVREANKSLAPGDFVYLDIREKHVGKLENKAQGPFEFISTDGHTVTIYRLGLLGRVHSDRLTPAPRMRRVFTTLQQREPCGSDRDDEYVVESLLVHCTEQNGDSLYQVRWYGYEEPDWQPARNIHEDLIDRYHRGELHF